MIVVTVKTVATWVTKFKTLNFYKIKKLKFWQKLKTQIVTKLKNSNCDKTQNFYFWQKSKAEIDTKLKKTNCDKTQKLKLLPNLNIARIAKRCPENISLVVKCLKLLFLKVLRKYTFFSFFIVVTAVTVGTVVRKIMQPHHKKKSGNLYFFLYFFFSVLLERAIWHIWQPMWWPKAAGIALMVVVVKPEIEDDINIPGMSKWWLLSGLALL